MNSVTRGAVTGAVYGAASAAIGPAFFGVVGRFLMYNVVEFIILYTLSGAYGGLTGQDALNKRVLAATPTEAQLVVTNPQVVMDRSGIASQMIDLTFTNRSKAALENVRFWCGWKEARTNRYEDVTMEDESLTTVWVLQRFEPGTVNRLRVGVTSRLNAASKPTTCTVMYDDFDLSQSVRGN
ncbi:MAG: hypothetical protein EOO77_16775 [Oxalobacteraceae bacterium]|nr:MAG: hypothetical protein EOO77_16775 [Oxalobacteraceae bacterium]